MGADYKLSKQTKPKTEFIEIAQAKKELIVVNTRNHFDHAYGNAQFERVYCHEYEAPVVRRQNGHIWDYLFYVFPGYFVTDLENISVRHMLDACEAVRADPEENATFRRELDAGMEYFRYVDGLGFLIYTLKSV